MKSFLHTLSLTVSFAVLSASGAYAAAEAHHGDAHAPSAGLPQMDHTWFASQIFWLAITFIVLYVVFSKKILPELSAVIETRREHIQGDLDNAQALKDEAEKVQQAYEEIMDDAHNKTSAVFAETDQGIKSKIDSENAAFLERSQKEAKVFEKRIEKAKQEAMDDMNTIAAEIASEAAEKITGISTDIKKAKDVVKSVNKQTKRAA